MYGRIIRILCNFCVIKTFFSDLDIAVDDECIDEDVPAVAAAGVVGGCEREEQVIVSEFPMGANQNVDSNGSEKNGVNDKMRGRSVSKVNLVNEDNALVKKRFVFSLRISEFLLL